MLSPKSDEERVVIYDVPYANVVSSLMFAMICTRPDLAHAVSLVSRFMSNPDKGHWLVVKWILRYIRGTLKKGMV